MRSMSPDTGDHARGCYPCCRTDLSPMSPVCALPSPGAALPGADPVLPGADPALPGADPALPGVDPALPGVDPALRSVEPALRGVHPALRSLHLALFGVPPPAGPPLRSTGPPWERGGPPLRKQGANPRKHRTTCVQARDHMSRTPGPHVSNPRTTGVEARGRRREGWTPCVQARGRASEAPKGRCRCTGPRFRRRRAKLRSGISGLRRNRPRRLPIPPARWTAPSRSTARTRTQPCSARRSGCPRTGE
jgi:hypothetical protein